MSLPKEPRQKMINIMYLVLTALLALNVSVEILNAFKTVERSLNNSSSSLTTSNDNLFQQLQAKLDDVKTKDKAGYYKPMADHAKELCEKVYQDLEKWKDSLKRSSGWNPEKGDTTFNESDIETPTRLFIEHENGKKLYDELKTLRESLLAINDTIRNEYGNKLPIDLSIPKSQSGNSTKGEDSWEYNYFHMTPTIAALTMMSKFQNDVKNSENQIVTYCNNQINTVAVIYDQFKALVSTNSTYLMPGEDMVVTAGIGSYSKNANPKITINGHTQEANADGVAIETFKPGGSGSVHVDVEYKKPDGTVGHATQDIPYTVGQSSSATVSLDKEDVFYIGLDNPITVGSPTGMDKTGVNGTGCVIKGSGPHRTVSVSNPGTCTITVTPQGSAAFTHTYRIKRIPEPELKIGSGKPRMPSVEVKSQTFCRADMGPDFIYDVHYSVVSATVYFSGAGFSNVVTTNINGPGLEPLKSYMARCMPGSVITFDNVKVSGPDGTRIIEGKSFALY